MVLVPLSSSTLTLSAPACGWQSTTIDTVASLLSVVPSLAWYLNEAGPQTPAPGMNRNAPLGESDTVPPAAEPADRTAVRPFRAKSLPSTPDGAMTSGVW